MNILWLALGLSLFMVAVLIAILLMRIRRDPHVLMRRQVEELKYEFGSALLPLMRRAMSRMLQEIREDA